LHHRDLALLVKCRLLGTEGYWIQKLRPNAEELEGPGLEWRWLGQLLKARCTEPDLIARESGQVAQQRTEAVEREPLVRRAALDLPHRGDVRVTAGNNPPCLLGFP